VLKMVKSEKMMNVGVGDFLQGRAFCDQPHKHLVGMIKQKSKKIKSGIQSQFMRVYF
jgi:hypothetical protein